MTRVALVTGGTDGIGRAVALGLAHKGFRVIITGRDRHRGAQVLAGLREAHPAGHEFLRADLALLADTARLADEVRARTGHLDAVVFCAGNLSAVAEWTVEGLERTLVLNYLSRYLLARRLLPLLNGTGRLVLVANAGKYGDTLNLDDPQHRAGRPGLAVSGRTQFANDVLAVELAHRVRHTGTQVTCVFPGVVRTSVFRNATGLPVHFRALIPVLRVFAITPEVAARTPVHLAHDPDVRANGEFYGPNLRGRAVPARVADPVRRQEVWRASETLVRRYLPLGDAGSAQDVAEAGER